MECLGTHGFHKTPGFPAEKLMGKPQAHCSHDPRTDFAMTDLMEKYQHSHFTAK